jgi:hypothetical protein
MWTTIQQLVDRVKSSDEVLAVVIAALLSLLSWIVLRILTPRARIAWGISHQHAFLLQNLQSQTIVYTREIWIQNIGRARAEGLEVILNAAPNHFDVWPQRHFAQLTNPNGNLIIKFDDLNRREHVTISMFQPMIQLPLVTNVRWSGGQGMQLPMAPQRVWPNWFIRVLFALLILGAFTILYVIVRLVQYVIT